jgi:serine/threonine protein kinase
VWLAEDLGTRALRAVKLVAPSAISDLEAFNEEARVLNLLEHPNIIRVYGTEIGAPSSDGPDGGMYAIIMEYMKDGSLEDAMNGGGLLLRDALHRFAQACRGAERAHANGYVHRDIKPANILLNGLETKLSGFGLAQPLQDGFGLAAGTPIYIAPEVIESGLTSTRSDIYSLGVTLYELVNGPAFLQWNGPPAELGHAITRGTFPDRADYAPFVPAGIRKIIKKALAVDSLRRFRSVADFRHALELVRVQCSWQEQKGAGECWLGMGTHGLFRIRVDGASGTLDVSRCKTAPGTFRRITADCLAGASTREVRQRQEIVMQRITTEGR